MGAPIAWVCRDLDGPTVWRGLLRADIAMTIENGTMLTCTNPDCGCRLRVEVPCPHGDEYRCGCGHDLVAAEGTGS